MNIRTIRNPHICKTCGKTFPFASWLFEHERAHKNQFRQCGKYFHEHFLTKHMGLHTEEKPYECEHCGKKFPQSGNLNVHMRLHTEEKSHDYEQCEKKFTQSGHLKDHMKVHTVEKSYRCEEYRKKFTGSRDLNLHDPLMRWHTGKKSCHRGKKSYQCQQCSKKFNTSNHLKAHMRLHTGEKPYQCDHCGKEFTQSGHLQVHKRLHTGEKPYRCKLCSKKFKQSGHLQLHMRCHSKQKPYDCDQCGKRFYLSSDVKRHLKVHSRKETILHKYINSTVAASTFQSNRHFHLFAQNIAIESIESSLFTLQVIPVSGSCCSPVVFSIFNHPNIAVTYGVTVSTCGSMLVMEKVVTCLSDLLAELGEEVTVRARVDICYGIVCAVDYLHHHVGVVHGYIDLDNVFVTSRFTAKLLDPSAAFLMHEMRQRAESFTDDLHQLICLLITMLCDMYPTFTSARHRLHNMISNGVLRKRIKKYAVTSELLQILDELRKSKEYCNCLRNCELALV